MNSCKQFPIPLLWDCITRIIWTVSSFFSFKSFNWQVLYKDQAVDHGFTSVIPILHTKPGPGQLVGLSRSDTPYPHASFWWVFGSFTDILKRILSFQHLKLEEQRNPSQISRCIKSPDYRKVFVEAKPGSGRLKPKKILFPEKFAANQNSFPWIAFNLLFFFFLYI